MTIVGEAFVALRPETRGFATAAEAKIKGALGGMGFGSAALGGAVAGVLGTAAIISAVGVKMAVDTQSQIAKLEGTAHISAKAAKAIGTAFLFTGQEADFSREKILAAFAPVAGQLEALTGHAVATKEAIALMRPAMDLAKVGMGELNTTTAGLSRVLFTFHTNVRKSATVANLLYNAARITNTPLTTLVNTVDKLHAKLGTMLPTLKTAATLLTLPGVAALGSRGVMLVSGALNHLLTTAQKAGKATDSAISALQKKVTDTATKIAEAQTKLARKQAELAGKTLTVAQQYELTDAQNAVTTATNAHATAVAKLQAAQAGSVSTTNASLSAMQTLGVNIYNSHHQLIPFVTILKQLHTTLGKLTQIQRQQALTTIFGTGAWQVMTKVVAGGLPAWQKAAAAVSKHTGLSHAVAAANGTVKVQMEQVRRTVDNLVTVLGGALLPMVEHLLHLLAPFLDRMAKWISHHQKLAGVILVTTVALAGLVAVLSVLGAAMAALSLPVLIIGAIIGIGVAIYEMNKHWGKTKELVRDAIKWLMHFTIVRDVVHWVEGAVRKIVDVWKSIPGPLKAVAVVVGIGLAGIFLGPLALLIPVAALLIKHWRGTATVVKEVVRGIADNWRTGLDAVLDVTRDVVGAVMAVWRHFLYPLVAGVIHTWEAIVNWFHRYGAEIRQVTRGVFGAIATIVRTYMHLVVVEVKLALLVVVPLVRAAWAIVKAATQAAWDVIVGVVKVAWRLIEGMVLVAKDLILGVIEVFLDIITGHWSKAWHDLVHMLKGITSVLVSTVKGVFEAIIHAVGRAAVDLFKGAIAVGKALVEGFVHGVTEAFHLATDAVKSVAHGVIGVAKSVLGIFSPSRVFYDFGHNTMDSMAKGIRDHGHLPQDEINKLHLRRPPIDKGPAGSLRGEAARQAQDSKFNQDVAALAAKNHESTAEATKQLVALFTHAAHKSKDKGHHDEKAEGQRTRLAAEARAAQAAGHHQLAQSIGQHIDRLNAAHNRHKAKGPDAHRMEENRAKLLATQMKEAMEHGHYQIAASLGKQLQKVAAELHKPTHGHEGAKSKDFDKVTAQLARSHHESMGAAAKQLARLFAHGEHLHAIRVDASAAKSAMHKLTQQAHEDATKAHATTKAGVEAARQHAALQTTQANRAYLLAVRQYDVSEKSFQKLTELAEQGKQAKQIKITQQAGKDQSALQSVTSGLTISL